MSPEHRKSLPWEKTSDLNLKGKENVTKGLTMSNFQCKNTRNVKNETHPKVTNPTLAPNDTNLRETLDREFKIMATDMFRGSREDMDKFLNEFRNIENQLNKIRRLIWGMKTQRTTRKTEEKPN